MYSYVPISLVISLRAPSPDVGVSDAGSRGLSRPRSARLRALSLFLPLSLSRSLRVPSFRSKFQKLAVARSTVRRLAVIWRTVRRPQ